MFLTMSEPTVASVRRFIKAVAYTGRYVYGRKHWRRVLAGGDPVPSHRPVGQFIELTEHHEGYISYDEYVENQKILAMNHRTRRHSQLGPGAALLQGISRCGLHGTVMSVYYTVRARGRHWGLRCIGEYIRGGEQCVSVPGRAIEELVVQAILDRLDVCIVDEVRRLWKQERADWRRRHAGIAAEVRQQEAKVARLVRLIADESEMRPNLSEMLKDEAERETKVLDALKARAAQQEDAPDPFTDARWEELLRLCEARAAIWHAATTTDQDRKQLIRILVSAVVVEHVDPELIRVRVEWSDGTPARLLEIRRTPYFHRVIWEMHEAGANVDRIVAGLGVMGARTQQGRAWSKETVIRTIAILKNRGT